MSVYITSIWTSASEKTFLKFVNISIFKIASVIIYFKLTVIVVAVNFRICVKRLFFNS